MKNTVIFFMFVKIKANKEPNLMFIYFLRFKYSILVGHICIIVTKSLIFKKCS